MTSDENEPLSPLSSPRVSKAKRFRKAPKPVLAPALGKQRVGRTSCFLCGRRLTKSNRSDEHVFPKWLQHRYGLWDLQLTLLNGSSVNYRRLTIPCCRVCNTRHLAKVETKVKRAVSRGAYAVRRLGKQTLFQWLSKLLYGILYKEGLLTADRRARRGRRITSSRFLRALAIHHRFMQSTRLPMRFHFGFPASIFVFRLVKPADVKHQFNFRDAPSVLGIAVQMGSVGIVAVLHDGGAQAALFAEYMARYQRFALHPLQFLELIATVFYKASLHNRIPKYLTVESTRAIEVIQTPLGGMSARPIFDEWVQEEYARILGFHIGLPLDEVYRPTGEVMTWLNGNDGLPRRLTLTEQPWPPSSAIG